MLFTVQGDTAEILIHVANFENTQGGIPIVFTLGVHRNPNV